MSRIGKKAIDIPAGVEAVLAGNQISVKGPKGALQWAHNPKISVEKTGQTIVVSRPVENAVTQSLHGVTRTVIANMVTGVTQGFEKALELVGVGYKAQVQGNTLVLNLGYSHPVNFVIPDGVSIAMEGQTVVKVRGIDKALVGQVSADIRSLRKPEPYKGKGVKYATEKIRRKEGKTGK